MIPYDKPVDRDQKILELGRYDNWKNYMWTISTS